MCGSREGRTENRAYGEVTTERGEILLGALVIVVGKQLLTEPTLALAHTTHTSEPLRCVGRRLFWGMPRYA